MKNTYSAIIILLAVLFIPAAAQNQTVPDPIIIDPPISVRLYELSPDTVDAGNDFTLSLLSYSYTCGTTFSQLSAEVIDNEIYLSFLPTTDPSAICTMVHKPYGPKFKIPALESGFYQVKVIVYPSCMFPKNPDDLICDMAYMPQSAGVLTVTDSGVVPVVEPKFILDPTEVDADVPFALSVKSYEYDCGTAFSSLSHRVDGDKIYLTFLPEQETDPIWLKNDMTYAEYCPGTDVPYGPSYKMDGLPEGRYEVYAIPLVSCMVPAEPGGAVCEIAIMPQFAGILSVKGDVDPVKPDFFITPREVREGVSFDLSLLSYDFNCANTFSEKSVNVSDGRIDLTYLTGFNPHVDCAAINTPYGPVFEVEALKPGKYEVYSHALPECWPCRMMSTVTLAGVLVVNEAGESEWSIAPEKTEAEKPFTLQVLNDRFNSCYHSFSNIQTNIYDNEITVSFVTNGMYTLHSGVPEPIVECKTSISPWGPRVEMKGLPAGKYPVYAAEMPACAYDEVMPCRVKIARQLAGVLEVADEPQTGWFLDPKTAAAGEVFELSLLNHDLGSCGTSFANQNIRLSDGAIYLSFTKTVDSNIVCIQNVTPFGPSFDMEPLKAGEYKVYASDLPACLLSEPRCLMREPMPEEVGVLTVGNSLKWEPVIRLLPDTVDENKSFEIEISSYEFGCNAAFDNKEVEVVDNEIILKYDYAEEEMVCPAIMINDVSTSFTVEGLEKGLYYVHLRPQSGCVEGDNTITACYTEDNVGYVNVGAVNEVSINNAAAGVLEPSLKLSSSQAVINLPAGSEGNMTVQLYSTSGKLIYESSTVTGSSSWITLTMERRLTPGLYLARVKLNGNKVWNFRPMVSH